MRALCLPQGAASWPDDLVSSPLSVRHSVEPADAAPSQDSSPGSGGATPPPSQGARPHPLRSSSLRSLPRLEEEKADPAEEEATTPGGDAGGVPITAMELGRTLPADGGLHPAAASHPVSGRLLVTGDELQGTPPSVSASGFRLQDASLAALREELLEASFAAGDEDGSPAGKSVGSHHSGGRARGLRKGRWASQAGGADSSPGGSYAAQRQDAGPPRRLSHGFSAAARESPGPEELSDLERRAWEVRREKRAREARKQAEYAARMAAMQAELEEDVARRRAYEEEETQRRAEAAEHKRRLMTQAATARKERLAALQARNAAALAAQAMLAAQITALPASQPHAHGNVGWGAAPAQPQQQGGVGTLALYHAGYEPPQPHANGGAHGGHAAAYPPSGGAAVAAAARAQLVAMQRQQGGGFGAPALGELRHPRLYQRMEREFEHKVGVEEGERRRAALEERRVVRPPPPPPPRSPC